MKQIKLAQDTINKEDIDALCEWLKQEPTPQLTKGPLTLQMEEEWAKWVGKKYGVFCNSGSSANLLMAFALKYSNRLKNNKVIVASTGWVTTLSPFIQADFDVIMCKSDYQTFGVDLDDLEKLCRQHNPGTVIFVQPLGILVDKERLLYLKMKYGFFLLEDACAALGSEYYERKAGSVGDMSSFSLFFAHQASTLEGGLVFTDDTELYNILVSIRSHGWLRDMGDEYKEGMIKQNNIDNFNQPFTFLYPGFNLRATDLQAFLGLRQIKKLDSFAEKRHQNHLLYYELLEGTKKIKLQEWSGNQKTISSISFALLAPTSDKRRMIVQALINNGIETRMYSAGALYKHKFYTDIYGFSYYDDVSDAIHDKGLFLPNQHCLKDEDIHFICDIVKKAL